MPKYSNETHSIALEGVASQLPLPSSKLGMCLEEAIQRRHSSRRLGRPEPAALAGLLWHACRVRQTGVDSWARPWTSASAPSAGGILACRVIVDSGDDEPWCYDPYCHAAVRLRKCCTASLDAARREVHDMVPECDGSVLYIISNSLAMAARYQHPESLQFRDSGALMTMLALCATSVGLGTCLLGHHGDHIVDALELDRREWSAVGAIAIGTITGSDAALDG